MADLALPADIHARPRALAGASILSARWALAALVAVSAGIRWLLAAGHATPVYFPDEFLYAELSRTIAATGRPLVHGAPAQFPALLEPLLTAPLWLIGDAQTSVHLTQGLHALVMSLAAIPVYVLARRLRLSTGFALGAAVIAVASPDLLYASLTMAEPVAYPLVLGAMAVGVRALAAPSARTQLAFVALAGLAAFARVQYAVLPIAFLVAALAVERGRPLVALRRFRVVAACCAAPVVGVLALGPSRVLGPYVGVFLERLHPGDVGGWMATSTLLLAYAAGWVLVPGALAGLACALLRPHGRAEAAFAALTISFAVLLLGEAALVADLDSHRFHERYLFVLLPLAAPALGIALRRGRRAAAATAGIALGLLLVAVRVPIVEHLVGHERDDSPTLLALVRLEWTLGIGEAALAVALVAGALSLVAAAAAFRPRLGGPAVLALAAAVAAALSIGAWSYDAANAGGARRNALPAHPDWVDRAGLRDVALLEAPDGDRGRAFTQLYWNRSVGRVLLLPDAQRIDSFAQDPVRVTRDGRLLVRGNAVRTPLLVETTGTAVELRGAVPIAREHGFRLWRPAGIPRLSLLARGRASDDWLAAKGSITVWPGDDDRTRGTLMLSLALPRTARATTLTFLAPSVVREVSLRPGGRRELAIPVEAAGPWTLRWSATERTAIGLRLVAARAPVVRFERAR